MSSPAQKVSPAPLKTTTRHSRSTLISFTAALSSAETSRSSALCFSGRFKVTVVTGPLRSMMSFPDADLVTVMFSSFSVYLHKGTYYLGFYMQVKSERKEMA
jgi:hypothetical protein